MAANVTFEGGKKLKKLLETAGKGGIKGVDVGVFATAKYPSGIPVATVAAWMEFGTKHIPERPALRIANKINERVLLKFIKKLIDPKMMIITEKLGNLLGANHQGAMQKSIINLRDPANAESTKKRKGSTNPLIDTGLYKNSITFKVIK